MQTIVVTVPELERAANQWTVDVLHGEWGTVPVVTCLDQMQPVSCEDSTIILFERTTPEVLKYVLQNGGHPWLVCDIVNRMSHGMHYRM